MLHHRRRFFEIIASAPLGSSVEETQARRGAVELARHPLTGPFAGFDAVLVELNSPPNSGTTGAGHRHPGPVLGYVFEGQMRFGINNQPVQVLDVGQTFFEPAGVMHTSSGSASTSAGARAVAFQIVPTGSSTVTPG